MKKHFTWIACGLVVAAVALTASDRAGAGTTSARLTLQGTYIDSGFYGASGLAVPRNKSTAIGKPLSVDCPSSRSCTIEADLFIQSGLMDVTGNQYSLCLSVDGALAPNCQIVGSTPADRTYSVGSTSQLVTGVTPGEHVVQAYVSSVKGSKVFNYTSNYRVYA
jgi:hypothetical protein